MNKMNRLALPNLLLILFFFFTSSGFLAEQTVGSAERSRRSPALAPVKPAFAQSEKTAISALFPGAAIRFDHLNIEDGLSQSVVMSIAQDKDGFLWFGTQDGLNRYDGYKFVIYKPDPDDPFSVSDRWISVLFLDKDGYLWTGTRQGGLNRYDPATGKFTRYQHNPDNVASLTTGSITAITQDKAGHLWVGTSTGLNCLNPDGTFTRFTNNPKEQNSLSGDHITALLVDSAGELWVGTRNGLDRLYPKTGLFQHYRNDPKNKNSLTYDMVTSLAEDARGNLWIGTSKGLNSYHSPKGRFTRYEWNENDPTSLGYSSINKVFIDASGIVWAGTNASLERLDPSTGKFRHFRENPAVEASLSTSTIFSIFQDAEGVLWFGTWGGGVNKYDPHLSQFGYYRADLTQKPYSLSTSSPFGLFPDKDGSVWLGAYGSGLDHLDMVTGEVTSYSYDKANPESLSANSVLSILRDSSGTLWVGTEYGLNEMIAPGKFVHHLPDKNKPDSISGSRIPTLYEDRSGNLWIGTSDGLNRYDRASGKFVRYNEGNPIPGTDGIMGIAEDKSGSLWLASISNGIYRYNPQTGDVRHYFDGPGQSDGLTTNFTMDVHVDAQNRLWVATWGGGLNLYDPVKDQFSALTERDGLANDSIYGIVEQANGTLWLSTNFGISHFDPVTKTFKNYTARDGLQSNEFNQSAFGISADGIIFLGGVKGLTVFDPETLTVKDYRPPLRLTSLSSAGTPLGLAPVPSQITLKWPQTALEFEFTALGFSQPNRTQYAYLLENFDKDWNNLGNKRDGRYTNLPGGTYTLRLRATNADGFISEDFAPLTVTVIPPFWQTGWFIGLVVVLLAGAGYGGYRLRIHAVVMQKQELEYQVTERTREIEKLFEQTKELVIIEERNRLARELHDSAKQKAFAALAQLGTANGLIQRDVNAAQTHIREAENLVHDVIQELTFLIQEMYPLALQEKGLVTALREYIFEWENRSDIYAALSVENERRLPLKIEQALYRITQEALANVARHSRAHHVDITLAYADTLVALMVVDDGTGFDMAEKAKGIGLRSIRERAESVGGQTKIDSAPGSGTRIEVSIPQ